MSCTVQRDGEADDVTAADADNTVCIHPHHHSVMRGSEMSPL